MSPLSPSLPTDVRFYLYFHFKYFTSDCPQPRVEMIMSNVSFLEPLPKPRAALSSSLTAAGGEEPAESPHGQNIKTSRRGKRPVPLPRRLSSLSSPTASTASSVSSQSSPGLASPYSPSQVSPGYLFKTKDSPVFKKSSGSTSSTSSTSSPRRKSGGVEVPTPTANYKSYRRLSGAGGEGGEREETARYSHNKCQAPLPGKLKSVTRLSFDQQPPHQQEESVGSPVRITVRQEYRKPPAPSYLDRRRLQEKQGHS